LYYAYTVVNVGKKDAPKCPGCKSELAVDRRGSKQAGILNKCAKDANGNDVKTGKCPDIQHGFKYIQRISCSFRKIDQYIREKKPDTFCLKINLFT